MGIVCGAALFQNRVIYSAAHQISWRNSSKPALQAFCNNDLARCVLSFEDDIRAAARRAQAAVDRTIEKYASGFVTDEDDMSGVLAGNLDAELQGKIAGLTWTTSIVRHRRGIAAEEKAIGADLVIHMRLNTRQRSYSKGVLIQAKRYDYNELITPAKHKDVSDDCSKMLAITASAFIFNYGRNELRCGSASRIRGTVGLPLHRECEWTSYRFFLELFRCPIGDVNITSAKVSDLPAPNIVKFVASDEERRG
jgi:hypothetical protein